MEYLLSISCYLIQWLSWEKENQPKNKSFPEIKRGICNRKIPEGNNLYIIQQLKPYKQKIYF